MTSSGKLNWFQKIMLFLVLSILFMMIIDMQKTKKIIERQDEQIKKNSTIQPINYNLIQNIVDKKDVLKEEDLFKLYEALKVHFDDVCIQEDNEIIYQTYESN